MSGDSFEVKLDKLCYYSFYPVPSLCFPLSGVCVHTGLSKTPDASTWFCLGLRLDTAGKGGSVPNQLPLRLWEECSPSTAQHYEQHRDRETRWAAKLYGDVPPLPWAQHQFLHAALSALTLFKTARANVNEFLFAYLFFSLLKCHWLLRTMMINASAHAAWCVISH